MLDSCWVLHRNNILNRLHWLILVITKAHVYHVLVISHPSSGMVLAGNRMGYSIGYADNEMSIKLTNTRPDFFELQTSDYITVRDYLSLLLIIVFPQCIEHCGWKLYLEMNDSLDNVGRGYNGLVHAGKCNSILSLGRFYLISNQQCLM